MKAIVFYLIGILAVLAFTILRVETGDLMPPFDAIRVPLLCGAMGGVGGCIYCLRAVYLNACVHKTWADDWQPWYYIRPLVSIACGFVSYLFLRAGLLVLESGSKPDATEIGFLALALIAGLNVDKFIAKIEDVAQAVWGIEKSRAAKAAEDKAREDHRKDRGPTSKAPRT